MPDMIEHQGRPASPGLADGPIARLKAHAAATRPALPPADEAKHFEAAIGVAAATLAGIIANIDDDAAAILEFQIAMLEDDALTGPVLTAIAGGTPAGIAWNETMEAEISGYEAAEDEYFRARASDLKDIGTRVLAAIDGTTEAESPPGAIVIGDDLTPSRFLATDWTDGGIALEAGSASSHVAMLARARGVPMAVGLGPIETTGHERAVLDGAAGAIVLSPDTGTLRHLEVKRTALAATAADEDRARTKSAVTACGTAIAVNINIAGPGDLVGLDPEIVDGIGLVRTEFLLSSDNSLRDEDRQYGAYREIVAWAKGRAVTIRTIDAGGDKPIPGYTVDGEADPFLGLRGLRLSLKNPEIFRLQLRALARAAAHGPVRIMLPMVTIPGEIAEARSHLDAVISELDDAGIEHGHPVLGMMVEVPATAFALDRFAVDFASIGSNDLVQYMTASARDNAAVADLCDAAHPAISVAIHAAVEGAARGGFPVSLCGDTGGDPAHLPMLLNEGLRSVSVAIPALGRTKLAISSINLGANP